MKKVLITGGHVTPALAVIDKLQKQKPECQIVFVGRKYINESEKQTESFEYKEVTKRNIRFIHLSAGRLTRILTLRSIWNALQIPFGFFSAFGILTKEKPDAVLSFGGYLAVPIAVIGKLIGIKVFTHEQTIYPGLANKVIAQFADTVFLSFPESAIHFKGKNVVVSGNPIRKTIFNGELSLNKTDKICIYITGGSIGAHGVNVMIEEILSDLLRSFYIIHQTGSVQEFNDFQRLSALKKTLPKELADNYYIQEHFSDTEIGSVYKAADIVVGRSGANTFFELVALQKPAVFIPLPWSANGEQELHATLFKEYKTGEMVQQSEGSVQLLETISKVAANLPFYVSNFTKLSTYLSTNAEDTIIDSIFKE